MPRLFIVLIFVGGIALFAWYILQAGTHFETVLTPAPAATTTSKAEYKNATADNIFTKTPQPGERVSSQIAVSGFARGSWYFEGTFPIQIVSPQGALLAQGQGRAQTEWTTNDFVPFSVNLVLQVIYSGPAMVVLKKDNPSGDPARDASLSVPIYIQ